MKATHFFSATNTWIYFKLEEARRQGVAGLITELEQELRNREDCDRRDEEPLRYIEKR